MIWWLNTAAAQGLSRFLKGPVGVVAHFFVMGHIYGGVLSVVVVLLEALPFPVVNITPAEMQAMSPQEAIALVKETPVFVAALVGVLVVGSGTFVLQIMGTFRAAKIFNAAQDERKAFARPSTMGLIRMICVIGITMLVLPSEAVWVAVGVGYLLHIRREAAARKCLLSGIIDIDSLEGTTFEKVLASYFKFQGYQVEMTPKFDPSGADLVLVKDGTITIVQAKRYKGAVCIEAVRAIIGAKAIYEAKTTMVVTNSDFTPNANKLANANGVILWDRRILIEKFSEAKTRGWQIGEVELPLGPLCPECGRLLVERTGCFGRFLGCLGFPKCRHTRNIN